VREINQAGGAWGYTVELVAYDDGGTVEGAVRAARNLALDPDVVAVLGHFRQPTTLAALDVYAEAGLPLIAIGAGRPDSQEGDQPLLFWGAADQALAQALCAHLATTWPDHRWVLLSDETHASLAQALRRAAVQYQVELVLDEAFVEPADLTHFFSEADGLLLALQPRAAGEVVLAWRQAGWPGVVAGGPSLSSPLFVTVTGEGAWGTVLVTPYRWPDDPAFISAYRGVGPHTPAPGLFALATYESFTSLVNAMGQVDGRLTRERLAEVLQDDRLVPPGLVFIYRLVESGLVEQAVFP
jgi:ABC-type branched-subunit amino acid transport system substrate-binding protein